MPVIVTSRVTGPEVGDRVESTGAEAFTENDVVAEPVVVVTVTVAGPAAALKAIWNVAVIAVEVVTYGSKSPAISTKIIKTHSGKNRR